MHRRRSALPAGGPGPNEALRDHRISALDGLRGFSVLFVFLFHLNQHFFSGGTLGVTVFFVLSGYLITGLIVAEISRTGALSIRRFYRRRFFRLAPALIVLVAVVTPVAVIAFNTSKRVVFDAGFALIYLTNFWHEARPHLSVLAHTWSLGVEEQFYLLWPILIVVALRRRWSLAWVIAVVVFVCGTFTVLVGARIPGGVEYLPTTYAPALAGGALIAVAAEHPRVLASVKRVTGLVPAMVALGLLLVALFTLDHVTYLGFQLVAALVCTIPVAHLVLYRQSLVSGLMRFNPLRWLGERSYGFYLWHYPILLVLARQLPGASPWMRGPVAFGLTLLFTVASWNWVEKPIMRFKNPKMQTRREPPGSQVLLSEFSDVEQPGVAINAAVDLRQI